MFQSLLPLRHVAELISVFKKKDTDAYVLLMSTYGGPNHNCKHLPVETALIAMFLLGGMDTMVVLRTALQQSRTNPAERIMPVLNLGLKSCSLARTAMDEKFEVTMRMCNGMGAIRRAALDSMLAAKNSLINAATLGGGDANNIAQEQSATEPLTATTIDGGEANNIAEGQPSTDSMNTSIMGGGEVSNIAQEQPSDDLVNTTTMGGEEYINITQEQPSME